MFSVLTTPSTAFTDRLSVPTEGANAKSERPRRTAKRRVAEAAAVTVLIMPALIRWLTRLTSRLAQHEVQREVARTLQRSLLPTALPSHPGARCGARYLPTSAGVEVGGDWYDVFVLPGGDLGLAMGDVAGHDVQAAGVMGNLRSMLRAYALEGHRPGEVLTRINRFADLPHPNLIATCLYAVYAADRRVLTWASAGHLPPLLTAPDGTVQYLEADSPQPPIGALPECEYVDADHLLPPGARLLLFTDGLVERRGTDLEDGMAALAAAARVAPAGTEAACDHVLHACLPDGKAADDVALLVMETMGPSRQSAPSLLAEPGGQEPAVRST